MSRPLPFPPLPGHTRFLAALSRGLCIGSSQCGLPWLLHIMPRRQQRNCGSIDPVVNEGGEVDTIQLPRSGLPWHGRRRDGTSLPGAPILCLLRSLPDLIWPKRQLCACIYATSCPAPWSNRRRRKHARSRTQHAHAHVSRLVGGDRSRQPSRQRASAWADFCSTIVVVLLHRRSCGFAH